MLPLAQPPRKEDARFDDWIYRLWKRISATAGIAWAMVDKTGSNLTDLVTRNHNDLQSFQGGTAIEYYHLTSAQNSLIPSGTPTVGQVPTATSGTASTWQTPSSSGGAVSNVISTPTTIAADTSYIVASYLNITSDLTIAGNLMVIG